MGRVESLSPGGGKEKLGSGCYGPPQKMGKPREAGPRSSTNNIFGGGPFIVRESSEGYAGNIF